MASREESNDLLELVIFTNNSMCPGGEDSSSFDMEEYPTANETLYPSHSEDETRSNIAGSLFELTPRPKNHIMKFSCDANGVQSPILEKYFGVVLAFAALWALIRGNKTAPHMKLSPKLHRAGLQIMLKNAMDRLQVLALNAQDLEQKVKEGKEATHRDIEAWEDERRILVQKLSVAEAQVASVHKSRQEDAKANEKVVGIFASYEQSWKNEKKKLKREIELLRNEIVGIRKRSLRKSDGGNGCEECKSKLQELEKLEDKLCEKEFLIAAAMDEARSDQRERNQLAGKLTVVELCILDLKDKLSKEVAKNAELQVVIAEVARKHEEAENKAMCAMSDLESSKREIESISAAKMNQNAMIEELLKELTNLRKDVDDKEEVIAVLMKRSNIDRQEREELLHQVAISKSKRKAAETEKDRWKRLAEERARNVPVGKDALKARRSWGSKVEMDKLSEIQRSHNEEVHGLRSMYVTKLESLQEQLKSYEGKVALLEARISGHSAEGQKRKPKEEERSPADMIAKEYLDYHELVTLLKYIVPDSEVLQLDGFNSEIQEGPMTTATLKDWLRQWLEVVKTHHAQHLEQRHWRELDAFERQMRLKDERLESFRWQLLSMESEFSRMRSELEMLESRLAMAVDEKCRAERAVESKDKELRALMKTTLQFSEVSSVPAPRLDQLSHHDAQQRILILLKKELNDAKKKLEEIEFKHQKDLLKVVEDTEAELRQKDHHLAVVEARLCQLRIQIENQRRLTPKGVPDVFPEEAVPEKVYKIAVVGAQEVDIKNAISTACTDVEKLADQIAEVRKQMLESDDNYDNGLEELIAQATAVSNSGKKLSLLRNAISIEEVDDTTLTLFQDHQTTCLHLKAASQTKQDLPSRSLELAMEHEILHQPFVQIDEASISGAPEGEISEDSTKSLDTDSDVTSKREQGEDAVVLLETDFDLENVEDQGSRDREVPDKRTMSSKKRERRKTLEEYFLDSPPELAVENAFQVPVLNSGARKDVLSFSNQGVLQAIENNTLAEITPEDKLVLNVVNPSQAAIPLFNKIKSGRSECRTREEIQVLSLALEVQKIEEQLLQIDRKCVSPPDVIVNPRTGLGMPKTIPPKKFNKRYAALTGKVGQLAKQMGLTSERNPEIITDNPLFNRRPTTSEILSLQHRAEAVCQSLALIEAQDAEHPNDESVDKRTGYLKERLVDTVKAHLSQVERSLSSRVEPIIAKQQLFTPNTATSLKRM